jgi:hypothetical protein
MKLLSENIQTVWYKQHGFPMVKIGGRLECVAEYLDRCIGQQLVVDVSRHEQAARYVFENGHELPLLCGCCGGPLVVSDRARHDTIGRRLVCMGVVDRTLEDGREIAELDLEFSKKGVLSTKYHVQVAFEAAAKMRHPAGCPHGRSLPAPKHKAKTKKR